MEKLRNRKSGSTHSKPEWKIILENLVYQDHAILFSICRRMIIYLDRIKAPGISAVIEKLNPSAEHRKRVQNYGQNWPKPKGSPFNAHEIIDDVFEIADSNISDTEISDLLRNWIHQEHQSVLSRTLERRHAPLTDVIEAVKKYLKLFNAEKVMSRGEITGLRVGLLYRFLSENLRYINIAKDYIPISAMDKILDRVIGPARGNGKLGGKSAGLILAREIIFSKRKTNRLLQDVTTPKSRFLTSDGLLEFIHYNALEEFVFTKYQNVEEIEQSFPFIEYIFKSSHFPPESIYAFSKILDDLEGKPIIVRSSSLLEDSFEASFSGKYKSLFLSNSGSKSERLAQLMNAIAEVYASSFAPDPIEYRREKGMLDFREEMGILIQQVVGNQIGKYYLPSFAGVAFTYNEFRWSSRIKREDGIMRIVAGLGTRAVDRTIDDYPALISPGQPGLRVNQTTKDAIRYSQQYVDVIDLETNSFETVRFEDIVAESKGNFPGLDMIVSFNRGGTFVEPVSMMSDFLKEDMVITFNSLASKTDLIDQIKEVIRVLTESYGCPVDVEFASNGNKLYLLQCRPQSSIDNDHDVTIPVNIPEDRIIFTENHFVNNGIVEGIEYVVYVCPVGYSALTTEEEMKMVGKIVNRLNQVLPRRKFILIGPGRWGSKGDIKLGVSVGYSDINNTAMLIEEAFEKDNYVPELSFGTHFFQDLVEADIKYLPLYPGSDATFFREEFFATGTQPLRDILNEFDEFADVVRVIKISDHVMGGTLSVFMDGESRRAVAFIKG